MDEKPHNVYRKKSSKSSARSSHWPRYLFKDRQNDVYGDMEFAKTRYGFKHNCIETSTQDEYWISGCKKDGSDALYAPKPTPIDDDVREEYWTVIRNKPELKNNPTAN